MADEPTLESLQESIAHLTKERDEAIKKRDVAKMTLREFEDAKGMSEQERVELAELRQQQAAAEEKRKIEAGEFDAAKKTLLDEKAKAEAKAQAAEQRYAQKVVEAAFAGAADLFGPNGRTTLTPGFAYAGMGRHVEYVPGENGHDDGIVVKDLTGEIIRGSDGRPAPFPEAMATLIDHWPGKEQILRSGQKAGSGSTGGSGEAALPGDRAALIERAAAGDPQALQALRSSQPQGRTIHGAHWDKLAAAAAAKP